MVVKSFGTVYKVKTPKGNIYALKQFRKNKPLESFFTEAFILKKCGENGISPRVIEINPSKRFIVMDLLEKTLFDVLNRSKGVMNLTHQKEFVKLINKMDRIGVYHGDPSPLNFMFNSKNKMMVIDFGFGKDIDKDFIKKHRTPTPNLKFMLLGIWSRGKNIYLFQLFP